MCHPAHRIAPPQEFAVVPSRSITNVPSKADVWMSRERAGLRRVTKYFSHIVGYRVKYVLAWRANWGFAKWAGPPAGRLVCLADQTAQQIEK